MSAEDDFQIPGMVNVQQKPAVPRFFTEPEHMGAKSREAGRPIYEDREMVEIIIPGDMRAKAVELVNDEHRQRWPKEYRAFKAGEEAPLEGTPLKNWPPLTAARVRELAYLEIKTVEHLAGLNDAVVQRLGMGAYAEREAAKKFLEVARTGTGPLMKMLEAIERLTAENTTLKSQNAALVAELQHLRGEAHAGAHS